MLSRGSAVTGASGRAGGAVVTSEQAAASRARAGTTSAARRRGVGSLLRRQDGASLTRAAYRIGCSRRLDCAPYSAPETPSLDWRSSPNDLGGVMHRRTFLANLGLAAAAAPLGCLARSVPLGRSGRRLSHVGIQLYTLRDDARR